MTNTEAISILNGHNLRSNAGIKGLSALDIGIEAIKKQIPQKPKHISLSTYKFSYNCPNCDTNHTNEWCGTKCRLPFCSICGQALDWGEDKCTTT